VVKVRHGQRAINRGPAQWRVVGYDSAGREIVVVYDHPHDDDPLAARIVSVWPG